MRTGQLWRLAIAGAHVLDRVRKVRSRADELAQLRRRLIDGPGGERAGPLELASAREQRRLRHKVLAALGDGPCAACAGCARGRPEPHGRWSGGFCCGGATENLWSDDELAALWLAGTRPFHLGSPGGDQAGCVFRGAAGCSLRPAHRPSICVSYLCRELQAELHARGVLDEIETVTKALEHERSRFARLRAERHDEEALEIGAP